MNFAILSFTSSFHEHAFAKQGLNFIEFDQTHSVICRVLLKNQPRFRNDTNLSDYPKVEK